MVTSKQVIAQAAPSDIRDGELVREMRDRNLRANRRAPPQNKAPSADKPDAAQQEEQDATEADRKRALADPKEPAPSPAADDSYIQTAAEPQALPQAGSSVSSKAADPGAAGAAGSGDNHFNPLYLLPLLAFGGGGGGGGSSSAALTRVNGLVLAQPTVALRTDTGASASDLITSNPRLSFSVPVETVTRAYSVDGSGFSSTAPSFAVDGSAEGSHRVVVRDTDVAGNQASSATLIFTLDTIAPVALAAITGAQGNALPLIASVPDGGATKHSTLALSGTVDLHYVPGDQVVVFDGGVEIGTALVTGHAWSFTTPTLAEGSHSFSVNVRDAAGNLGHSSIKYDVVLDTIAPDPAAALLLAPASDLGFSAADNLTSDATPTINVSATLNDGEVLQLFLDGSLVARFAIPPGGSGPYLLAGSYTPGTDLADGYHSISTQVVDAAGNASGLSTGSPMHIDTVISTTLASVDLATDNLGLFTGAVGYLDTEITPYAHQGVTNDSTLALSGRTDAALAADEKVAIYDSGTFLAYATPGAGNSWTYTATIAGDGTHAFTARVLRESGAPGDESATLQVVLHAGTPDLSLDFHSGVGGSIIDVSTLGSYLLQDANPGTATLDAYALAGFTGTAIATAQLLAISGSFTSGSLDTAANVATDLNAALAASGSSFQPNADLVLLLKDLASPPDAVVWRYHDGIGGAADGRLQAGELTRLGDISFASGSDLALLLAENFKLHP